MKWKILIVLGICVFVIGVVLGTVFFNKPNSEPQLTFNNLCLQDKEAKFVKASISLRSGEKGEESVLLSVTSESKQNLLSDIFTRLESFTLKESQEKSKAQDFISLEIAYSESEVCRVEIYRDLTVLILGTDKAGIYRAVPSQTGGDGPYDLIYTLLTGEAPR